MVVVSSQTMHAILFLVFCFVNVALLFVFIGAEFVAFLLLILYVGAIAVLFVFTIMLLNIRVQFQKFDLTASSFDWRLYSVASLAVWLLVVACTMLPSLPFLPSHFSWNLLLDWSSDALINLKSVGLVLYTVFALLCLVVSFVLCVAMLGAIVLTLSRNSSLVSKKQDVSLQLVRNFKGNILFYTT